MKFLQKQVKKTMIQTTLTLKQPKIQPSRKKKAHQTSIIRHTQTTHHWKKGEGQTQSNILTLILWNVNGFRAVKQKGDLSKLFLSHKQTADFICLNQTKIDFSKYKDQSLQNRLLIEGAQGYNEYWNFCKVSSGYSGVMTFSKHLPMRVVEDMPEFVEHNKEGRIICLQFDRFYLVNMYKPNAGDKLVRLNYRLQYEDCFREHIKKLQQSKPVIIAGDMNVANEQIDLKNPKANQGKACFTIQQRNKFKQLLEECNLLDSFRHLHPNTVKYSFWSYRRRARLIDAGWRLDYILVDKRLKIRKAQILNDVYGSDHCPVLAEIQLNQQ